MATIRQIYRDREQDILDKWAADQISNDEAAVLLAELYADRREAEAKLNQTEPKGK